MILEQLVLELKSNSKTEHLGRSMSYIFIEYSKNRLENHVKVLKIVSNLHKDKEVSRLYKKAIVYIKQFIREESW